MKIQIMWLCFVLAVCALTEGWAGRPDSKSKSGLLIMAHGGDETWNQAVRQAIEPLQGKLPVEIAFGMADRHSLERAVGALEAQGVGRIAVVRLFVSAASFRHQTEYFLGLRPDPPERFLLHAGPMPSEEEHYRSGVDPYSLIRVVDSSRQEIPAIQSESQIDLSREGLYDSPLMGQVILERVRDLSRDPAREAVLVLAHGEGEDELNQLWKERIGSLVEGIRKMGDFREVRAETLREDWFRKREEAEAHIQAFFERHPGPAASVLVVPFRVFGFGPYRAVLEGQEYIADGKGLLPHPDVTRWIQQQAEQIFERNAWPNPFNDR